MKLPELAIDKIVFALKHFNRACTSNEITLFIKEYQPDCTLIQSDIYLFTKRYPLLLKRYKDINNKFQFALRAWFSGGKIKSEFKAPEIFSAYKLSKQQPIKRRPRGPITKDTSFYDENCLGPLTFNKENLALSVEYDSKWITSNKILFLLNQSPSLSTDQIIEAIIEFEPSQKRRVKNVRENIEICIKRLLRDQKIAQLTTDTYYLTIY